MSRRCPFTLGNLLDSLLKMPQSYEIRFDFCDCIPGKIGCWRGSYAEPALGWRGTGYSAPNGSDPVVPLVRDLVKEIRTALSKPHQGWKGGEYRFHKDSSLWIDNPGDCSRTRILAIQQEANSVTIITGGRDD